jgi:hypothetical protein
MVGSVSIPFCTQIISILQNCHHDSKTARDAYMICKEFLQDETNNEIIAALHRTMSILSFYCVILLPTQVQFLLDSFSASTSDELSSSYISNLVILSKKCPFYLTNKSLIMTMLSVAKDNTSPYLQVKSCQVLHPLFFDMNTKANIWNDKDILNAIMALVIAFKHKINDTDIIVTGYAYAKLFSILLKNGEEMKSFYEINFHLSSAFKDWAVILLEDISRSTNTDNKMDKVDMK